jgi:hypothetical protein
MLNDEKKKSSGIIQTLIGPNPKIKIQRLSFSTGPEVFKKVSRNPVAQKFMEDIFLETGHFGSKAVPRDQ